MTGALLGTGISFAFASMANLIVGAVAQEDVGIATGINTVTRTVGGAFGSAISTAILAGHLIPGTSVPTEGAYTVAFLLSAAGGLLAIVAARFVPAPQAGARGPARAGAGPALSDTVPACPRSTPSASTAGSPWSPAATAASGRVRPALGEAGARVAILARDAGPTRSAPSWARSPCPPTSPPRSVAAVLERGHRELGPVDILVNNAGVCFHRPGAGGPAENGQVFDINVDGLWYCAQAAGEQMIEAARGVIVNIGSISAHDRQPAAEAAGLQRVEGGGAPAHQVAGGRVGAVQYPRQRARSRLRQDGDGAGGRAAVPAALDRGRADAALRHARGARPDAACTWPATHRAS